MTSTINQTTRRPVGISKDGTKIRRVINMNPIQQKHKQYLVPGVAPYYEDPLVLVEGKGRHVVDSEGRRYLDFFGGILTVSVGHAHPRVAEAIAKQAQQLLHTSQLYLTESIVNLAERLARLTPGALQQSFFTTSGTEANETAIMMAQLATGHQDIVALRHSYSGRSQVTMGLTGQAEWKLGGAGMALPIRHTHNAYCYRCPFGKTPNRCGLECAKDMEEFIRTSTSGHIAAYLAEPIQGVGGFITPPPEFFQETVPIAKKYGALFIDDEVQTGFGRTGKMFGIEHYGVNPDMMVFAKGIANGMPIAASITTPEVASFYRGPTISTFGGNPVATQAALATLDVITAENLVDNAKIMGEVLRRGLESLSDHYPIVGDVRGKGLMQGLEFVRHDKNPAGDLALEFLERTRKQGLLVGKGGLYGNVIRIAPPLSVTHQEIQEGLQAMDDALRTLYHNHSDMQDVTSTRIAYDAP